MLFVKKELLVCLFLIFITSSIYSQIRHHDFIDLDDNAYVAYNYRVQQGLTAENVCWAFRFNNTDYWLPLAWLSHMLDCQLFGLDAGMHHLSSLSIHIASSLLLFLFLRLATGSIWKSAVVAAFFALHPINVDSVGWIAERKSILSGFFWMLTLMAYGFYIQRPNGRRYLLVLLPFIIGLMAKPMLITLPFVLLLLDYWPFNRIDFTVLDMRVHRFLRQNSRLLLEKIPLLLLTGASITISSLSLQRLGHFVTTESVSMSLRLANALVSYPKYIVKMIWPRNFCIHYPYPTDIPPVTALLGSALLLTAVSVFAWWKRKELPFFLVGWLWFLGTFVPAIGLTFSGIWGAINDRFAYIPFIGLFIALVWTVSKIIEFLPANRVIATAAALFCVIILAWTTWTQNKHWKNSISLFEHCLQVTENNFFVHNLLGASLAKNGRFEEAIQHYKQSIKIRPSYFEAYNNLGIALVKLGKPEAAIPFFTSALKLSPDLATAHNNLGNVLAELGQIARARKHYEAAIRSKPDDAGAYNNLGTLCFENGKLRTALHYFQEALRLRPNLESARRNLNTVEAAMKKQKMGIDGSTE